MTRLAAPRHVLAMLAFALVLAVGPAAAAPGAVQPIRIAEIGHVVVGGERVSLRGLPTRPRLHAPCPDTTAGPQPCVPPPAVDPNGDFTPGATYVQFIRLASPRHPYPLLLLPGGGLDGSVYETTPDGRPGWESFFLRAGWSLYIADLQQTGRSPFARYPEINPLEPAFRDQRFLWETFRIGPPGSWGRGRQAYAGTQFPVAAFDAFARLAAPYFRVPAERQAQTYDAIIRRTCPCVIVAHSAASGPAIAAGYRNPGLVKAIVAAEPATVPPPEGRAGPPVLILWGDYLSPDQADAEWAAEREASCAFARASPAGAAVTFIDLPRIGIRGNSHLLMADRNSDRVAALIDQWLGATTRHAAVGRRPAPGCEARPV